MDEKNVEFMDEKIIELINEKEKEIEQEETKKRIEQEIQAGSVTINGESIAFEEKSLLDGRIKIRLPQSFEVMSPELASLKYPSERRPNPIFTNDTTSKNISFNYMDTPVLEEKIGEFKDSMQQVLQRLQPTAIWLEDGTEEVDGKQLSFFEFVSPAIDTNVYNLMFFAELDGRALICAINCIEEDMEDWQPIARGMMHSFKVCRKAK